MSNPPKDITFHYTNEQMVKDLIALTPLEGSVLDAGSGILVRLRSICGREHQGLTYLQGLTRAGRCSWAP